MPGDRRVVVADDEPSARRGVRQLLAAHPGYAIVGECRDGPEVLAALDALAPDLVFLDIQMPGLDGFEVIARRAPARMPLVVFLTAYGHHALRAFEAEAVDYLMKPVSEARFAATMQRVGRVLAAAPPPPGLVVTTPRGQVIVELRAIDWIEAADNYARLWVGERDHLMRESLGALEERTVAHGFLRAHRRALIRLAAIQRLDHAADGGLVAVLASGARIPISRRRRAAFASAVRARGV
ncbi:MAG TPA: LytTR family DNA-binding domain-containing protein [Kofleriaceae bacterium]|nr:LytTR family DNA-binding domain-containing protein [Kofleriaceae bacterium]